MSRSKTAFGYLQEVLEEWVVAYAKRKDRGLPEEEELSGPFSAREKLEPSWRPSAVVYHKLWSTPNAPGSPFMASLIESIWIMGQALGWLQFDWLRPILSHFYSIIFIFGGGRCLYDIFYIQLFENERVTLKHYSFISTL